MKGQCPEGLKPCIENATPGNSFCYPEAELQDSCPITHIDVVNKYDAMAYHVKGYTIKEMGNDKVIVYST